MMEEWYTISNVEELDTPALVIYPERVRKNLEIVRSFVGDPGRLRPHVKTNKCPQVVRMMLDAGISKFKCATIAEAEMLAVEKARDVLLAYQPVGPKARRFCRLQQKYPQTSFACLVDNPESLRELSAMAMQHQQRIRVFIDLNVGMNRTGIAPGEEALALFRETARSEGIDFIGLHAYDGHLHDADPDTRRQKCAEAFRPVDQLRAEIEKLKGSGLVLVAGGTPTFPIHAKRENEEASPGTFVFWDRGYQQKLSEQPYELAALVVTRVISVPTENSLCTDLGHKSIASENALAYRVYLLNAPDLQPIGHSEEHMVFQSKGKHNYRPGDVFYGVPHHICPTVALYDEAGVCVGHKVGDTWPILSGKRKITV